MLVLVTAAALQEGCSQVFGQVSAMGRREATHVETAMESAAVWTQERQVLSTN